MLKDMARRTAFPALALLVLLLVKGAQSQDLVKNLIRVDDATNQFALPEPLRGDRDALLDLASRIENYFTLPFRIQLNLNQWTANSNPCLPLWPYIECQNGRVSAINLSQLGLQMATLPPTLGNLNELVTLSLEGNSIHGVLPAAFGQPIFFNKLKFLNLANNNLGRDFASGNLITFEDGNFLPDSWAARGSFPMLVELDLSGNDIAGPLPDSWAQKSAFRQLVSLALSGNEIGGMLPASWGSTAGAFPLLVSLDLSDNVMTGLLPAEWGSATAFQTVHLLDLSGNQFFGAVPASWGGRRAFPRLENLLLFNNDLGPQDTPAVVPAAWATPDSFGSLKNLVLYPGNFWYCTPDFAGGDRIIGSVNFVVANIYLARLNDEQIVCPAAGGTTPSNPPTPPPQGLQPPVTPAPPARHHPRTPCGHLLSTFHAHSCPST